jgi:hypothetical protein
MKPSTDQPGCGTAAVADARYGTQHAEPKERPQVGLISAPGWGRWWALGMVLAAMPVSADRPNVLFIIADDMRFELGAYGAPHVQTPHLDRLAAEGAIFLQAHCQYPLCTPSRSNVFTGRRPDTTRVYDVFTHFRDALPEVVTLPQLFWQQGYTTHALGKVYHTNMNDPASWSVPHREPDLPPLHWLNPATAARLATKREAAARLPDLTPRQRAQAAYGPAWEAEESPDSAHHDGQVTEMALEALQDYAEGQEPFFLAVGYRKPHLPFVAPKTYFDRYDASRLPLAVNPARPIGAPPYGPIDGGEFRAYEDLPPYPILSMATMPAACGRPIMPVSRLWMRRSGGCWRNSIDSVWGKTRSSCFGVIMVIILGSKHIGESGRRTSGIRARP